MKNLVKYLCESESYINDIVGLYKELIDHFKPLSKKCYKVQKNGYGGDVIINVYFEGINLPAKGVENYLFNLKHKSLFYFDGSCYSTQEGGWFGHVGKISDEGSIVVSLDSGGIVSFNVHSADPWGPKVEKLLKKMNIK